MWRVWKWIHSFYPNLRPGDPTVTWTVLPVLSHVSIKHCSLVQLLYFPLPKVADGTTSLPPPLCFFEVLITLIRYWEVKLRHDGWRRVVCAVSRQSLVLLPAAFSRMQLVEATLTLTLTLFHIPRRKNTKRVCSECAEGEWNRYAASTQIPSYFNLLFNIIRWLHPSGETETSQVLCFRALMESMCQRVTAVLATQY